MANTPQMDKAATPTLPPTLLITSTCSIINYFKLSLLIIDNVFHFSLLIKSHTWTRDSHELFDYESQQVQFKQLKLTSEPCKSNISTLVNLLFIF